MQPWSPDELPTLTDEQRSQLDVVDEPFVDDRTLDFIEDRPKGGVHAFMSRLEPDERTALYELIEQEIRAEIKMELQSENEKRIETIKSRLVQLTEKLQRSVEDEKQGLAQGAIELSLAIGERLARQAIEVDQHYLIRVVSGIIDRTEIGADLKVIANPCDIEIIEQFKKELQDLNVKELVPDISLPRGGCIVRTGGQEWDLSFASQRETLAEAVRNAMLFNTSEDDVETEVETVEITS